MPRTPKKYYNNTEYYHVIVQGVNLEYIFKEDAQKKYYIKLLYTYNEKFNIQIIAYCIMGNHAHMLIKRKKNEELSEFMYKVNKEYAQKYNYFNERKGHVFRDRFKMQEILTEQYLHTCQRYIYNNPVKARICQRPEDYKFSNYKKIEGFDDVIMDIIDTEEDRNIVIQEFVNNYLIKYGKIDDGMKLIDKQMLVKILKDEFKLSYRKIGGLLGINKNIVNELYV